MDLLADICDILVHSATQLPGAFQRGKVAPLVAAPFGGGAGATAFLAAVQYTRMSGECPLSIAGRLADSRAVETLVSWRRGCLS